MGFLIAFIVVVLSFYLLAFLWIIPKTASIAIPAKWRLIPLHQSKTTAIDYLGNPSDSGINKSQSFLSWKAGSKDQQYTLSLQFASDTLASGYVIRYHYHKWFVSNDYLIDSFTINE